MTATRARRPALIGAFLLPALALGGGALSAQVASQLTGDVAVGLADGALAADVCVGSIPTRGDSVTLVLNRALTIKRISGVRTPPVGLELEPGGAAVRYTFAGAATRAGPNGIVTDVCLEYSGSFPVYDIESGDYRDEDASSVVAFDGRTVRARGVSRWYPAPIDPRSGLTVEAMAFSVRVECELCSTIYVNGGTPGPGPSVEFRSPRARELLLVAGDLDVGRHGGITYVGRRIPASAATDLAATLTDIAGFLEGYVGVPYGPVPDVLQLDALRAPRRGRLWGFFSDPALVLIGMSVSDLVRALNGNSPDARQSIVGFLAHELAHRYFGWSLGTGSEQRDLFGEPFATFLELKAIRHYFGEREYRVSIDRLRRQASASGSSPSLETATADDFARSSYRYAYSPLMLLTLEAAIGEDAMRRTLSAMLNAPANARHGADYAFLVDRARAVGVADGALAAWEDRCVRPGPFAPGCLDMPSE